jgi:glycosyltransferase 2 family protein
LLESAELPALSGAWPFGVAAVVAVGVLYKWRGAIDKWSLIRKAKLFFKGVAEGLLSIKNMQRKGAFLAHSFFIWFMYFGMAWVIFKSIDAVAEITVLQAIFIMVAGGFGMIMPAPGGIGAYHGAVMLGFVALGYNEELGLAVANVIWLTQTLMIVFTGGVAYLALMWYRIKKDRLTDSITKTPTS